MRKMITVIMFLLMAVGTASGDWIYEYTQDVNNRLRGIAICSEDDFAVGISSSTYMMQWYHTAPGTAGAFDCNDTVWNCPYHPGESIAVTYNWGLGIDTDCNVYLGSQDWDGANGSSVLVWDYNCNEVDRFQTNVDPSGTEYITAVDVDGNGFVYLAWYIASGPEVHIYSPMPWGDDCNHTELPVQTVSTGAYVTEGACVNSAGTMIWATNRSAPGTLGWVRKFVGSIAGGFAQDMTFGGGGEVPIAGYVRGIDADEEYQGGQGRIFVCCDGNGTPSECIIICNATTGAIIETLKTTPIGSYHNSPYDVEYDPAGDDLYIAHQYGWYIDKYHWEPPTAAIMSSFEATAGEEMVELSWRVQSERDNAGFQILRDGEQIAYVESQGHSDAPRTYTWIDHQVFAGIAYTYRIASVALDGSVQMHDFEATATPTAATVPTAYALAQNYPNPFNADTHIEFTLAKAGHTTLKVYNTTGQLVRTLVDGTLDARIHKVRWDGRNESGQLVASGIYFYRLASGTFAETKKMSFLR